eukprot:TRINITY_DN12405_c0_g1_i4.p1 TRINITY_DN12405_c0_g1~~TRINITY_DN12405_c0_g1_i4.p1  ORF type:complete len:136 (-),score=5.69 TRINITY_DN12405_c0_g1_i4:365-772(-)
MDAWGLLCTDARGLHPPDPSEVALAWLRARAMRGQSDRWPSGSQSVSGSSDSSQSASSSSNREVGVNRGANFSAYDAQIDLHDRGLCQPCAYYARKNDGCRLGAECEFCHLCDNVRYQAWKRRWRRFKLTLPENR